MPNNDDKTQEQKQQEYLERKQSIIDKMSDAHIEDLEAKHEKVTEEWKKQAEINTRRAEVRARLEKSQLEKMLDAGLTFEQAAEQLGEVEAQRQKNEIDSKKNTKNKAKLASTLKSTTAKFVGTLSLSAALLYVGKQAYAASKISTSLVASFGLSAHHAKELGKTITSFAPAAAMMGASTETQQEAMSTLLMLNKRTTEQTKEQYRMALKLAGAYGLSGSEASNIAHQFKLTTGSLDTQQEFFNGFQRDMESIGAASATMMKEIAGDSKILQRFNMSKGKNDLADIAKSAVKIGGTITEMLDAADSARTLEGALDLTANLTQWGMNMGFGQVLHAGRNSQQLLSNIVNQLIDQTSKSDTYTGQLRDKLDSLGSSMGISGDRMFELVKMGHEDLKFRESSSGDMLKALTFQGKSIGQLVSMITTAIMSYLIQPLIPLFQQSTEWVQENSKKLEEWGTKISIKMEEMVDWWHESGAEGFKSIVGYLGMIGGWLVSIGKQVVSLFSNKIYVALLAMGVLLTKILASLVANAWRGSTMDLGKGNVSGITNILGFDKLGRLFSRKRGSGGGVDDADYMAQLRDGWSPGGRAQSLKGKGAKPIASPKSAKLLQGFANIPWQNLMGGAAVLIAFAGAIWILSKAFQNFASNTKNGWGGFSMMIGTIIALAVSMSLLSLSGVGWAAVALVAAFGLAILSISYAFKIFANALESIPEGIGSTLFGLAGGIAALNLAFMFGGLAGGFFMLAGMGPTMLMLGILGNWAKTYANDLKIAADGVNSLASAFERMAKLDVDKLGQITDKASSMKDINISGNLTSMPAINTQVIVKIDSRKVADAMIAITDGRVA